MRLPGLALTAFAFSASVAVAKSPSSAEKVLKRISDEPNASQRETWFNAEAKGKVVAWAAPFFGATTGSGPDSFVQLSIRPIERGLMHAWSPSGLNGGRRRPKKAKLCCVWAASKATSG
jgi:hypothetical protein